jgi:hypothetical protein
MPVEITGRSYDPNDPSDHLARLIEGRESAVDDEPWVEPDYASIPDDADVLVDEAEQVLVLPGPALIMPAGLLPDGRPHSRDELDNATRICGQRVTNDAVADAVVVAYWRQQDALRKRAGLPLARRETGRGLVDLPETLDAIRRLHLEERARRLGIRAS